MYREEGMKINIEITKEESVEIRGLAEAIRYAIQEQTHGTIVADVNIKIVG